MRRKYGAPTASQRTSLRRELDASSTGGLNNAYPPLIQDRAGLRRETRHRRVNWRTRRHRRPRLSRGATLYGQTDQQHDQHFHAPPCGDSDPRNSQPRPRGGYPHRRLGLSGQGRACSAPRPILAIAGPGRGLGEGLPQWLGVWVARGTAAIRQQDQCMWAETRSAEGQIWGGTWPAGGSSDCDAASQRPDMDTARRA